VKTSKKISIAVVVVLVCMGGFFAFRTFRGLMKFGYVDSAIGRIRVLNLAEAEFAKRHPELGYTCTFSQLPPTQEITRLLAAGGTDNGYAFEIFGCRVPSAEKPNSTYYITARPLHSAQPAFCSDQSGVLRADYGGSVERCRAKGVPL
jgi:hypothetical protein